MTDTQIAPGQAQVEQTTEPARDGAEPELQPPVRRHRRGRGWVRRGIGLMLVAAGLVLGAALLTEPEFLDAPVGNATVQAKRIGAQTAVAVGLGPTLGLGTVDQPAAGSAAGTGGAEPGTGSDSGSGSGSGPAPGTDSDSGWWNFGGTYVPEVVLGAGGGEAELDACTGEFTEMVDYRAPGVVPLYSAHNTCDGDIILGWELGQLARVSGSDVLYEVVDERRAMTGDDAGVLEGMAGQMVLQTCFHGSLEMRFLALAPVQVDQA